MPNTELFQKIEQKITEYPHLHSQEFFAQDPFEGGCGTTRCVAGWAVQLSKEDPLQSDYAFFETYKSEHGVYGYEDVGRHLLGLSAEEAEELFYRLSDEEALSEVRFYIEGGLDDVLEDDQ